MKILGWNCRGISNASTVRALGAQIKGARPDVVFLSETKTNEKCMEFVKSSVKFDNKFIVEAKGSAGGLCILWKNSMSLNVVDFDKNLIAVKIADQCYEWLLVGFYGPSYHSKKSEAWGNLFALLESHQGPWACIGDFNFIINDDEQIGGNKGGSSATISRNYCLSSMWWILGIQGISLLGPEENGAKQQLKEDWTGE